MNNKLKRRPGFTHNLRLYYAIKYNANAIMYYAIKYYAIKISIGTGK